MIEIALPPGRYVVAVSGGVDSVVLLDMLRKLPDVRLTVAHFDHGIRPESDVDQRFVRDLARAHGLPYVYHRGDLGADASEAMARQARYDFLYATRRAAGASALVTAHHLDDVLETAVLNLIRGTGRRGLASLRSTDIVKRPLLHVPKQQIVHYARDNQLLWREDATNISDVYARNYVRHNVLSRFQPADRTQLHDKVLELRGLNQRINQELDGVISSLRVTEGLSRQRFILLPHVVAREVMLAWLRQNGVQDIGARQIERLVHAAKTLPTGRRLSVGSGVDLIVKKSYLALKRSER